MVVGRQAQSRAGVESYIYCSDQVLLPCQAGDEPESLLPHVRDKITSLDETRITRPGADTIIGIGQTPACMSFTVNYFKNNDQDKEPDELVNLGRETLNYASAADGWVDIFPPSPRHVVAFRKWSHDKYYASLINVLQR